MKRLSRFMLFALVVLCGHLPVAAAPLSTRDSGLWSIQGPAQPGERGQHSWAELSDGTAECRASARRTTAPPAASITLPADPVSVGAWVELSASFDAASSGDQQSATIEWGDGSTTQLNTSDNALSARHRYAAGVYTVVVRPGSHQRSDSRSNTAAQTSYVVVYNPVAAYVIGNGWIRSAAGRGPVADSCNADNGLARFGFAFRYQKGLSAPVGHAGFQLEDRGFRFKSMIHDWLEVSGATAAVRGSGWVNDVAGYDFLLTVQDRELSGDHRADRIRIKIWEKASGRVVYDNRGVPLSRGSVTIK